MTGTGTGMGTPRLGSPAPATPEELYEFAVALDAGYETIPSATALVTATQALTHGRAMLRDCHPGSAAHTTVATTLGMLEAARGGALFGCWQWSSAWDAYAVADGMFGRAGRLDAQLWVRTRQASLEVHRGRAARGSARAVMARQFAGENDLTGHPNYARFLTQGEARVLIATGQVGRAADSLAEADAVVAGMPPAAGHVGLSQLGYSHTEHTMSLGVRHNEIATVESGAAAENARTEAVRHVTAAWRELDERGVTGLRSYSRVELARTLVDDDPAAAAGLLAAAADISQDRPMAHLVEQYRVVARQVADRDVPLGRQLAGRLREWKQPAGMGIARRVA